MDYWAKKVGKIAPKHVQNTFGHFWKRLRAIFEFWSFLIVLKIFEGSAIHGTLGETVFWKNCPKTCSKQVSTKLGTILGIFGFLKNLGFFEYFRRLHGRLGKKTFSKKSAQNMFKTRLNTFVNDFGPFWIFEIFRRLYLPWNTGEKNFFEEKCSKTGLDTWERFWTVLELWNLLDFFLEFFLSIYLEF